MATRKYAIDVGMNEYQVTDVVGVPTGAGIELTADLAKVTSREDLLLALEKVRNYILRDDWPPA